VRFCIRYFLCVLTNGFSRACVLSFDFQSVITCLSVFSCAICWFAFGLATFTHWAHCM